MDENSRTDAQGDAALQLQLVLPAALTSDLLEGEIAAARAYRRRAKADNTVRA